MDYLCQVCDREIIENESEYKNYIPSLRKKDDKSIYKKYVINNIKLDEVDKIIKDYVSTHKKNLICILFVVNLKYNLIITLTLI